MPPSTHEHRRQRRQIDALLREIAREHHGLIDISTALKRGVCRSSIDLRIADGALETVRRGICRLPGTELTVRQRLAAVQLAAGTAAVLAGTSAAHLHGFWTRPGLEVAVPPNRSPLLPGVDVRRLVLSDTEITEVARIPVTTPARTLLDLAATQVRRDVSRSVDEVLARRIVSPQELIQQLERRRGHLGAPVLRSLLDERPEGRALRRSNAERQVAHYLREAGLGDGIPNFAVIDADGEDRFIDTAWPVPLVGLEYDSFRWHTGREDWRDDRQRANAITAIGWRIVVATDADLDDRLRRPIAALRTLLGR